MTVSQKDQAIGDIFVIVVKDVGEINGGCGGHVEERRVGWSTGGG